MQSPDVTTTIRLQGPLTVAVADAVKTQILDAFAQSRSLEIDVSGATEIDVSALQIFLAARKMAASKGATIAVLRDDRLIHELGRCGIPVNAICHA